VVLISFSVAISERNISLYCKTVHVGQVYLVVRQFSLVDFAAVHCPNPWGWPGWVDCSDWLHTKMVYKST